MTYAKESGPRTVGRRLSRFPFFLALIANSALAPMVCDRLHQLVVHDRLRPFRFAELSLAILVDLTSSILG